MYSYFRVTIRRVSIDFYKLIRLNLLSEHVFISCCCEWSFCRRKDDYVWQVRRGRKMRKNKSVFKKSISEQKIRRVVPYKIYRRGCWKNNVQTATRYVDKNCNFLRGWTFRCNIQNWKQGILAPTMQFWNDERLAVNLGDT